MATVTKEQCKAMDWAWDEKTQTCNKPGIRGVSPTLTRGLGCGGPGRIEKIKPPRSARVQSVLLKAEKSRKPGKPSTGT